MIPLQGNNTYLQGGAAPLQGGAASLQGSAPPLQGVNPPKPAVKPTVKPSSPSATSTVSPKQQYLQDLSSRYGLSNGTVYDKSTNTGLNLDQFKASSGISNPDWKSLKFDTAYTPPSLSSQPAQQFVNTQISGPITPAAPSAPAASSPKSAYLEYLRKQFNPEALQQAQSSLTELNKRTSEELLRARTREDELRANKIGQVESGLNYGLNENARLSNKSLADLALSKGYINEEYNRLLGMGESLYNLETAEEAKFKTEAEKTLTDTSRALLAQFESLPTQQQKDAYIRQKAAELGVSVDRVNSVLGALIDARNAASNKDLMSVSEGEAIWDPNTGEFVFKNPKTYESQLTAGQPDKSASFLANTAAQASQAIQNITGLVPSGSFGRSAALQESLPPYLQSSGYRNLQAQLDFLKSNIMFGTLQAMREASKTGGALGQVSDVEGRLLQSALGTLSLNQDKAQFEQTLKQIQQSVNNWGNAVNQYGGSTSSGGGGNTNDPLGLGFNQVGNTSASTGIPLATSPTAQSLTVKVASQFPPGSVGGQCGVFVRKIASNFGLTYPALGDGLNEKISAVQKYGGPIQNARLGSVIVTRENPTYGHVAYIIGVNKNGFVVAESNYKQSERVSYGRTIPFNSKEIVGVINPTKVA